MGGPLIVAASVDQARSLALIGRAQAFEVTGGGSVADLVKGCALFDVIDEGRAVAAFAVRVDAFESGREVSVTAAGGEASSDGATEAIAEWCESQARDRIGARVLTCQTRRRGLVRRLERQGYRITGYVLTKEI